MASVVSDESGRSLERTVDSASTSGFVTFKRFDGLVQRCTGTKKCSTATGDNTFFDCCTSCAERVFDAVLLFLEFNLGGCANLDDRNAARKLRKALLELLAIPIGIGVVDLTLDLRNTTVDVGGLAGTFNDGGFVLGHNNLAGGAEEVEGGRVELEADLFADDLAAGEDGHVSEHCLAALAETWSLDGNRVERSTNLVHDESRKRFTVDIFGDDQKGLARLHDLLEHGKHVLH
ncbi:unannotated protein [freshwater metagenome]|uniref:Unannotated protein n=1 Tax=freshwater metagenome TaxID=449393 RepID=A0A6J6N2B3_9ZZZZ